MRENGTKRPWLAAILAIAYPGLGHIYLGLWGRAMVWAGTTGLTAFLFAPENVVDIATQQGLTALPGEVSATTWFMLGSVTTMAAIDAYWHATRGAASPNRHDGPACPECGREVDEDLAFCQWCTAELDGPGE